MLDDDALALKAEKKAPQYGIADCRLDVPFPRHFTLSLVLLICLLVSAVLELQCRI